MQNPRDFPCIARLHAPQSRRTVLTSATTYRFGPFELDPAGERLTRGDDLLTLQPRPFAVLVCLVAHAGKLVTKRMLTDTVWRDVAVIDNAIVQAVSTVRQTLGTQDNGRLYIDTVSGKGYRFVAAVEIIVPRASPAATQAMLDASRSVVDARPTLESLNRDDIEREREPLESYVQGSPASPAAKIALANAQLLDYESSRNDGEPRRGLLIAAEQLLLDACALDPASDDGLSSLAVTRHRLGKVKDAIAAARKACELRPASWRHLLRLCEVSYGEERLIPALRVRTECPDLALPNWFAATVYVARQQPAQAFEHVRAGCALQDAPRIMIFPAVGMHWMHGLLLAAAGDDDGALEELQRELATTDTRHVYGREACANSWYAIGAIRVRHGRQTEAIAAFQAALELIRGHRFARIALDAANASHVGRGSFGTPADRPFTSPSSVDDAMQATVALALQGRHVEAEQVFYHAFKPAIGSAGWQLPIEPILNVNARRDVWARSLTALRARWL